MCEPWWSQACAYEKGAASGMYLASRFPDSDSCSKSYFMHGFVLYRAAKWKENQSKSITPSGEIAVVCIHEGTLAKSLFLAARSSYRM